MQPYNTKPQDIKWQYPILFSEYLLRAGVFDWFIAQIKDQQPYIPKEAKLFANHAMELSEQGISVPFCHIVFRRYSLIKSILSPLFFIIIRKKWSYKRKK